MMLVANAKSFLVGPPEDERTAKKRPPPATPVTLPLYQNRPYDREDIESVTAGKLRRLFIETNPLKWTHEHHRNLGVELTNNVAMEDLVPSSYLPPKEWEERPAPEQSHQRELDTSRPSSETLSNGASIPGHEAFYLRVNELKHTREDAIAAIARRPLPGKPLVKVAYYRRFWIALDQASKYWDTSKDDFRPADAPEPMETDSPPVKSLESKDLPKTGVDKSELATAQRQQRQQEHNLAIGAAPAVAGAKASVTQTAERGKANLSPSKPNSPIASANSLVASIVTKGQQADDANVLKDYYGIRTGAGSQMSNQTRVELAAELIDPVARAMGCNNEHQRTATALTSNRAVRVLDGVIKQDISGMVFRGPRDVNLARKGWNEGPLIVTSARPCTNFSQPVPMAEATQNSAWMATLRMVHDIPTELQDPKTEKHSRDRLREHGFYATSDQPPHIGKLNHLDVFDASQEVGALLMCAQFRARNAKSDQEPLVGQGKWWAVNKRFGGHVRRGEEHGRPIRYDDGLPADDIEPLPSEAEITKPDGDVDMKDEGSLETLQSHKTAAAAAQAAAATAHASPPARSSPQPSRDDSASKRRRRGSKSEEGPEKAEDDTVMTQSERDKAARKSERDRREGARKARAMHRDNRRRQCELRWAMPRPVWDSKTNFLPVGKGPDQDFDHVYLVSSLFHHVSILRLRVHPEMLDFLMTGSCLGNRSGRPAVEHFGLHVARSRWFDLLKTEDRVEAMRAIWGVLAYMMRDTTAESQEDKEFADRVAKTGFLATGGVSR